MCVSGDDVITRTSSRVVMEEKMRFDKHAQLNRLGDDSVVMLSPAKLVSGSNQSQETKSHANEENMAKTSIGK
jgi:hypothetical protein